MPNATRPLPGPLSAPWPVPCSGYQHLQRAHDLVAKPRSRKRAVCVACHTGLLLIAQCTRKRPRILNLTTLAVFERFFPIFRSSSISSSRNIPWNKGCSEVYWLLGWWENEIEERGRCKGDNSFIGSKEIFDTLLFIWCCYEWNCFVLWQVGFNFKKL